MAAAAGIVRKDLVKEGAGPAVVKGKTYRSEVTLYIENADGSKTPAGWSTKDSGPFDFEPGKNLIEGWTQGALMMKVGERSMIHVPHHLGYGAKPQGQQGKGWYIPGSSNLLFDLEIVKCLN